MTRMRAIEHGMCPRRGAARVWIGCAKGKRGFCKKMVVI